MHRGLSAIQVVAKMKAVVVFAKESYLLSRKGRGGCLRVRVLAFYSDDPSSNPAGFLNFLYEKMKIIEKEAGVGPSLK